MNIGISEMVMIGGIALVIIGPEKFPEFAKIVLRTFRDLRSYVDEAKGELKKELDPLKKEIDEVSKYKPEEYIDALTNSRDEDEFQSSPYPTGEEQPTYNEQGDYYTEGDNNTEGYESHQEEMASEQSVEDADPEASPSENASETETDSASQDETTDAPKRAAEKVVTDLDDADNA